MSVYWRKERNCFWYDFQIEGKRYQGVCLNPFDKTQNAKNITQAKQYETLIKIDIKKTNKLPKSSYTFAEAAIDYYKNKGQYIRTSDTAKRTVEYLINYFGKLTSIDEITNEDVDQLIEHLRHKTKTVYMANHGKKDKDGNIIPKFKETNQLITPATVNQYLAKLKAIFNRAIRRKKTTNILDIQILETNNDMPNPVLKEHAKLILENAAEHLKAVIMIAVRTGMRLNEILSLRWDQVFLDEKVIRLPSQKTKSKKGQIVYLSPQIIEYLKTLSSDIYVIEYRGKPIKKINRSWKTAIKKAGVPQYKFHNLRATFCTLIAGQPGTSMLAVKDLARHVDPRTTLRYMKSLDNQLHDIVNKLDF